jgi:nucleotide-binding universal stress UspA family protein
VDHKRLVVGVNGSKSARAALHWAVASASEGEDVSVHAVAAWEATQPNKSRSKVAEMLAREIGVLPETDRARVDITTEVTQGLPSEVLSEASQDADMLVLGRQGHGKAWYMMFGSTSEECARKADCPVVIVPLSAAPSKTTSKAKTKAA